MKILLIFCVCFVALTVVALPRQEHNVKSKSKSVQITQEQPKQQHRKQQKGKTTENIVPTQKPATKVSELQKPAKPVLEPQKKTLETKPKTSETNSPTPSPQKSSVNSTGAVIKPTQLLTFPSVCPEGTRATATGCRKIFKKKRELKDPILRPVPECIIGCQLPDICPPGQKPDSNGNCRDIWGG